MQLLHHSPRTLMSVSMIVSLLRYWRCAWSLPGMAENHILSCYNCIIFVLHSYTEYSDITFCFNRLAWFPWSKGWTWKAWFGWSARTARTERWSWCNWTTWIDRKCRTAWSWWTERYAADRNVKFDFVLVHTDGPCLTLFR